MKLKLNDCEYYIDEKVFVESIQSKVMPALGKKIEIPGGPSLDLSRRSLVSVALRQMFVFFVPFLEWMAQSLHMQLPKRERHGDIIAYCADAYFSILQEVCSRSQIVAESEPYVDDMRKITNVTIEEENSGIPSLLLLMPIQKHGDR